MLRDAELVEVAAKFDQQWLVRLTRGRPADGRCGVCEEDRRAMLLAAAEPSVVEGEGGGRRGCSRWKKGKRATGDDWSQHVIVRATEGHAALLPSKLGEERGCDGGAQERGVAMTARPSSWRLKGTPDYCS